MGDILTDGTIRLRAPEPEDLDVLYRWENDASQWHIGNTLAPFSRQQLCDYLIGYDNNIYATGQLRMIVEHVSCGIQVGTVDLFEFDPTHHRCGIGIMIDDEWRGQGLGTAAIRLICQYASCRLSCHTVWCMVGVDNTCSIRMFESAGFAATGHLRHWLRGNDGIYRDAMMMQLVSDSEP